MMMNISEKKQTQLRFFTLYTVSVILVFVIATSFLKAPSLQLATIERKGSDDGKAIIAITKFLNARFEQLQSSYNKTFVDTSFRNVGAQKEHLVLLTRFKSTLDSLAQARSKKDDQDERLVLEISALKKFCQQHDTAIAYSFKLMQQANNRTDEGATATGKLSINQEELTKLKQLLADRDRQIATLERTYQIAVEENGKLKANNRPSGQTALLATRSNLSDNEQRNNSDLKKKLEAVKDAFAKSQERSKELERGYKIVIDDNRRLLVQLQNLKKNKN